MGRADDARAYAEEAKRLAPKDPYTLYHSACVSALTEDANEAMRGLLEAHARGFYTRSECQRNTDLEILRGRPEFMALLG